MDPSVAMWMDLVKSPKVKHFDKEQSHAHKYVCQLLTLCVSEVNAKDVFAHHVIFRAGNALSSVLMLFETICLFLTSLLISYCTLNFAGINRIRRITSLEQFSSFGENRATLALKSNNVELVS